MKSLDRSTVSQLGLIRLDSVDLLGKSNRSVGTCNALVYTVNAGNVVAHVNVKAEDLSEDIALWQKIANSDVVNDIYKMYDYVNFLCAWNIYFINSYTNEKGETVSGYYLYASDAEKFIYNDGAQYNYGYKDGYFDSIVSKIEAVDKTAFADLVANIRKAEALAKKVLDELKNQNYTYEYKYVEKFEKNDYIFTLNKGEELTAEMEETYMEFSNWLGSWEM